MLLTDDLFETILTELSAGPGPAADPFSSGGGQRRGPRLAVTGRVTLIPFVPGAEGLSGYEFDRAADGTLQLPLADPQLVPVRNISHGGLRFMMSRRLPLNTPAVLLLPESAAESEDGKPALRRGIECAVTYWQPVQRDLFAVGLQFRRLLEGVPVPTKRPTIVLPEWSEATTILRPAV